MLLSQVREAEGGIAVALRDQSDDPSQARRLEGVESVHQLASRAAAAGQTLETAATALAGSGVVDLLAAADTGALLPPVTHPDPAHLLLTGTGLTHLGSASTRNAMHEAASSGNETDSMKMFRMGVEGGKPSSGVGVQPEWFYKGNGDTVAAPGHPLVSPPFAEDGGEEPEIAGVYLIGAGGTPYRLGFSLANEFSDHVMEKRNYLYLAHSKLRPASFGPELRLGPLPSDVRGTSRISRGDEIVFEAPFLSGEDNMSHTIANLEHHHFKYGLFRRPGDIHVHMFGTATLSFAKGVRVLPGDEFRIEAQPFGLPLTNSLSVETGDAAAPLEVRAL